MKTINSRQNPHIKAIVALKKPKGRRSQSKLLVEGIRVVSTVIEAGWQPLDLYVTETMLKTAQKISSDDNITIVTDPVMEKLSQATSPSGIVGVFKNPKKPKTEKLHSGLVLADVADPGNMGTLIRSCVAMGFSSVVIVDGADPFSHKVIQSTAGTIASVDIFVWSWEKLLTNKNKNELVALVPRDGKPANILNKENSLLVVGNEAHGIKKEWITNCDKKVTLPISGRAESLNAAVAGSIALYLLQNQS
ncbi:RNA methyltransferase [bacterium]|nr:RNA methyltransferase [bacterium]